MRVFSIHAEPPTRQGRSTPDTLRAPLPSAATSRARRIGTTYDHVETFPPRTWEPPAALPQGSGSACDYRRRWGGALAVVGAGESPAQGEGGQSGDSAGQTRTKPEDGRMSLTMTAQKQMTLATTARDQPTHRFTNLYCLLHWDKWIRCAADTVLARPGSSTAGIDGQTRRYFRETYEEQI